MQQDAYIEGMAAAAYRSKIAAMYIFGVISLNEYLRLEKNFWKIH